MTKRPHVMNAQQALEWCDRELADFARRTTAHDLDYAGAQLRKAKDQGDDNRRWYWAGVHERIARGDRLREAMNQEHEARRGPKCFMLSQGQRHMVADLDYWKVT